MTEKALVDRKYWIYTNPDKKTAKAVVAWPTDTGDHAPRPEARENARKAGFRWSGVVISGKRNSREALDLWAQASQSGVVWRFQL